jgi:hypothetical protein
MTSHAQIFESVPLQFSPAGHPIGTPLKDTMPGAIEADSGHSPSGHDGAPKGESLQGLSGTSGLSHGSSSKLVGDSRVARSTGSHCGGHAAGCSASASLLATLGLVMCGMTAAAAMPTRTSARKREACFFACSSDVVTGEPCSAQDRPAGLAAAQDRLAAAQDRRVSLQHGLQRNSGWRGSGGNGWFRVQDRRLCGGARGGVRGEAVGRGCLLQHVRRRRRGSTRQPSLSGAHLHGVVFKYVAPAWHSPRSCNKEHVTTMLQEKRAGGGYCNLVWAYCGFSAFL